MTFITEQRSFVYLFRFRLRFSNVLNSFLVVCNTIIISANVANIIKYSFMRHDSAMRFIGQRHLINSKQAHKLRIALVIN